MPDIPMQIDVISVPMIDQIFQSMTRLADLTLILVMLSVDPVRDSSAGPSANHFAPLDGRTLHPQPTPQSKHQDDHNNGRLQRANSNSLPAPGQHRQGHARHRGRVCSAVTPSPEKELTLPQRRRLHPAATPPLSHLVALARAADTTTSIPCRFCSAST